MTEAEILKTVKIGIKELSNYNDDEIKLWITTAKRMLVNAGVKQSVVDSGDVIGLITIIVDNLRLRKNILEDGNFMLLVNQEKMKRS